MALQWNAEQERVRELVRTGQNVFVTGPGGTGKTALIRQLVKDLAQRQRKVQVCALTGCAAVLLNCRAKTLHSWGGLGLAVGTPEDVVFRVVTNKYKSKNWQNVQVLIVDEISMMSKRLFDILHMIAQKTRRNLRPFGNIQVIFCGDFYQLPPVTGKEPDDAAFCFESILWTSTFPHTVVLHKLYRQTDPVYGQLLNELRVGRLTPESIELLQQYVNRPRDTGLLRPTILSPVCRSVDQINQSELNKLPGPIEVYLAENVRLHFDKEGNAYPERSAVQIDNEHAVLRKNMLADAKVLLKVGAQVMCVANIDMESAQPIVNGSQGIVLRFEETGPVVKFTNGVETLISPHVWMSENLPEVGIKQIPLVPAWAVTIHKAQGVSLDMAQIDVGSSVFEHGQTYVALSRVRSLDGLYLSAFDPSRVRVDPRVKDFYDRFL